MTEPNQTAPGAATALSDLVCGLGTEDEGPATVGEMMEALGPRAFGAALFVFALPNMLPLPPGSAGILGLPLLIIAPQLALGVRRLWIPGLLAKQRLDGKHLAGACKRLIPWVKRAEDMTTRRLGFLFGRAGDVVAGAVCFLLAAVLILPIPFGNLAPAAAIAALGLGLTQRDGLLMLAGYGLSLASAAILILSGHAVVEAFGKLGSMTGLW